ncbi:pyruvate formate-lyase-activating protein [Saccharicrinis fermentans]|uniref:Pyruvate formate-lyase-activating enzyme n=1 Tax=Saccharicrinis fermentans DSM 9555 = JCM 21142 TaxID=869213 RepID=W7Y3P7_9BACT|nr:pyruvate formate-lyase-activating protein [Saccharicrinis fermentans]GAF02642.1 pyruvate formate-lyase 1-activating enzyme [Saccharicrinis fermentans DSM 9555 = JCM 21142]
MPHLNIHSIESFGTHDGPGIRMVIFLQGCNLKCLYCHNPDTIPIKGGTEHELETLVKRAENMKSYFGKNGGVTVSGGEPLLQSKALIPFFKILKEKGIHTNIDTNGSILTTQSKELLDLYTDLIMVDIKHTHSAGYKQLTGVDAFGSSLKLIEHREQTGKPAWLRYVLIPGYTDTPEELIKMGERYKDFKCIEKIEIQPYHKLGIHKWESLGEKYQLKDALENTPEQIEKVKKILNPYFREIKIN